MSTGRQVGENEAVYLQKARLSTLKASEENLDGSYRRGDRVPMTRDVLGVAGIAQGVYVDGQKPAACQHLLRESIAGWGDLAREEERKPQECHVVNASAGYSKKETCSQCSDN